LSELGLMQLERGAGLALNLKSACRIRRYSLGNAKPLAPEKGGHSGFRLCYAATNSPQLKETK